MKTLTTISICGFVLLLCASPVGAKRHKRGDKHHLEEWEREGGLVKDWRDRACSIRNILIDGNSVGPGTWAVEQNLPWMNAVVPTAGEGIYAKAPNGVKIDGRLRFGMSESDPSSDFSPSGGFSGTRTAYGINLYASDGTALWAGGSWARHGTEVNSEPNYSVSSESVDESPRWSDVLARLSRAANCPARTTEK